MLRLGAHNSADIPMCRSAHEPRAKPHLAASLVEVDGGKPVDEVVCGAVGACKATHAHMQEQGYSRPPTPHKRASTGLLLVNLGLPHT